MDQSYHRCRDLLVWYFGDAIYTRRFTLELLLNKLRSAAPFPVFTIFALFDSTSSVSKARAEQLPVVVMKKCKDSTVLSWRKFNRKNFSESKCITRDSTIFAPTMAKVLSRC